MTHKVVRWCTAVFIAFAFAVGGAPAGVSAQSQGLGLAQSEASALKALSDPSSPVFRKIIYFDIDSFEDSRGVSWSDAVTRKPPQGQPPALGFDSGSYRRGCI